MSSSMAAFEVLVPMRIIISYQLCKNSQRPTESLQFIMCVRGYSSAPCLCKTFMFMFHFMQILISGQNMDYLESSTAL